MSCSVAYCHVARSAAIMGQTCTLNLFLLLNCLTNDKIPEKLFTVLKYMQENGDILFCPQKSFLCILFNKNH